MSVIIPGKYLDRDNKYLDDKRVNPIFARKCRAVLLDLRSQGYEAVLIEVWRSKTRAAYLKTIGASKNGTKSKHCIGKAADVWWFYKGKLTCNVPNVYWQKLESTCAAHELVYGGNWNMRDMAHFQLGN